jgi:hypothetical protein
MFAAPQSSRPIRRYRSAAAGILILDLALEARGRQHARSVEQISATLVK